MKQYLVLFTPKKDCTIGVTVDAQDEDEAVFSARLKLMFGNEYELKSVEQLPARVIEAYQ
jgi:hypothetical protein